jgi:hypothetical protein
MHRLENTIRDLLWSELHLCHMHKKKELCFSMSPCGGYDAEWPEIILKPKHPRAAIEKKRKNTTKQRVESQNFA